MEWNNHGPGQTESSEGHPKRVLLVDDHAVVRYGIAQLINQQSDLVVCGEEEDAANALSAIGKLKPDLVIADISLKGQQRAGVDAQH